MKRTTILSLLAFGMLTSPLGADTSTPQLPPAIASLLQKAEAGDAVAQNQIGEIYNCGEGVEMNEAEAVRWFKLAADQGNADAQCNLAECYIYGYGIDRDAQPLECDKEAVRLLQLAVAQGHAEAHAFLASYMAIGKGGLHANLIEARRLLQYAADHGVEGAAEFIEVMSGQIDPFSSIFKQCMDEINEQGDNAIGLAFFGVGICYLMGEGGVPINMGKAIEMLTKAAKKGETMAQFILAATLGATGNEAEAEKWLKIAADNQNPMAAIVHAAINKTAIQNSTMKALEAGDAYAQFIYAMTLLDRESDNPDPEKALTYLNMSAEQNFSPALFWLGICYYQGEFIEKNIPKALECWRKSASLGFTDAQLQLLQHFTDHKSDTTEEELQKLRDQLRKKGLPQEQISMSETFVSDLLAWAYEVLMMLTSKLARIS